MVLCTRKDIDESRRKDFLFHGFKPDGMNDFTEILGIRFSVRRLVYRGTGDNVTVNSGPNAIGLYLSVTEISPRVTLNVSDYVTAFSKKSDLADGDYGLPVGNLVKGSGSLDLFFSHYRNLANDPSSDTLREFIHHHMYPNVEARFYQKLWAVNDEGGIDLKELALPNWPLPPGFKAENAPVVYIPMGSYYVDEWEQGDDYEYSANLSDYTKFLAEKKCPDIMAINVIGWK